MIVRLFTDASIKRGLGTWGAVVPFDDGTIWERSGSLRGKFRSSTSTELCAIANGLQAAFAAGVIRPGCEVQVWSDNMSAVMGANRQSKVRAKGDPMLLQARRYIRDFAKRNRFAIRAYHIPGHQRLDSDDPQAIFNIRADHLCSAERDNLQPPPWENLVKSVERAKSLRLAREAREATARLEQVA